MGTALVIQTEQLETDPPPYGPWPVKLGARELLLAIKAYEGTKVVQPNDFDKKVGRPALL